MKEAMSTMIAKEVTEAGQEVVKALDKLMAVELASEDVARYGRIESLARITKSIRQRYATRVAQVAKGRHFDDGFRPLQGNIINPFGGGDVMAPDEEDLGEEGVGIRIGGGGGMGDMAQILRESMMMLQKTTENKDPPYVPSVSAQLDELLHMQSHLKRSGFVDEADRLTPRIKELATQAVTAPAGRPGPLAFIPRLSVDDYLDPLPTDPPPGEAPATPILPPAEGAPTIGRGG